MANLVAQIAQVEHILQKNLVLALFALLEPVQSILMVLQFV
jgi:hypothetical protein